MIFQIVLINWGCELREGNNIHPSMGDSGGDSSYCGAGIEIMGWGIWIGMFFTFAGSFGAIAAKNPSNCT